MIHLSEELETDIPTKYRREEHRSDYLARGSYRKPERASAVVLWKPQQGVDQTGPSLHFFLGRQLTTAL